MNTPTVQQCNQNTPTVKNRMNEKERLYELMVEAENAILAENPHITDSDRIEKVADVLLAAGFVFPPFQVGDAVFIITEDGEIIEDEVCEMGAGHSPTHGTEWLYAGLITNEYFWESEVGKRAFRDREQAEAALEKRKEERTDGNV